MCDTPAGTRQIAVAVPRPAVGPAGDPVVLAPADEVVITTLVDNVYDALLAGDERITRAPFSLGAARAPQSETGSTQVGLRAEHGFAALVSVRRGTSTPTLLFDTGLSPDAMVIHAGRLGADLSGIQAVVLSHGHFDHAGRAGRGCRVEQTLEANSRAVAWSCSPAAGMPAPSTSRSASPASRNCAPPRRPASRRSRV